MSRNAERDAIREKERRKRLLESGLRLFAEKGIEAVKLQEIADEAQVGIATLYNYYQNKVNLVVAISAHMWKRVWDEYRERIGSENLSSFNAYQQAESFFDLIIDLYHEHPECLRFSGFFKSYMNIYSDMADQENEHLNMLAPIGIHFHDLYEKAKVDKSIRTDVEEDVMFTTISLTLLGMAERYAQGIVWTGHKDRDYSVELQLLKEMMLNWLKV